MAQNVQKFDCKKVFGKYYKQENVNVDTDSAFTKVIKRLPDIKCCTI